MVDQKVRARERLDMNVTRAVILAAGEGSRLRPLTNERPKCLIEVGGESVLSRAVRTLHSTGISDICVVTGRLTEPIESLGYHVLRNPHYLSDNVLGSFSAAAAVWKEGAICAYADILFQAQLILDLLRDPGAVSVAIDPNWRQRFEDHWDDAERTELVWAKHGVVQKVRPGGMDLDPTGEFIGLIKISPAAGPLLERLLTQLLLQDARQLRTSAMPFLLTCLIEAGWAVRAVECDSAWHEFDTPADLNRIPPDLIEAN